MSNIIEKNEVPRNFFPKKIEVTHYVMGSSPLPKTTLMKNGHGWKAFRPVGETQDKNGIDPSSCPAGGTLNCYEHIGLARYKSRGFQSDLSERFLSIVMGMVGGGGWPWDAFEKTYRLGAVPEVFLPFDGMIKTLKQYFSPRPITYPLYKIGQHWLSIYKPGAEWVVNPDMNLTPQQKIDRMKEALQYSPLGVAGFAWSRHDDGKYYNDGPDVHFFNIDDYTEGESWDAYDTYPEYGKKLDWNYNPNYVIRYSLDRRLGSETIVFDPENAPECKLSYILYLISNFISQFKRS